jgi:hypothetical protein
MIGYVVVYQVIVYFTPFYWLSSAWSLVVSCVRFYMSLFGTDAPFTSPLQPLWVGFTLEEADILKGKRSLQ